MIDYYTHDRRAEILYYLHKGFKVRVPMPVGWLGESPLRTVGLPMQAGHYNGLSLHGQLSGGLATWVCDGSFDFRTPRTWFTLWYEKSA